MVDAIIISNDHIIFTSFSVKLLYFPKESIFFCSIEDSMAVNFNAACRVPGLHLNHLTSVSSSLNWIKTHRHPMQPPVHV